MEWIAKWLKPTADFGEVPPVYYKHFDLAGTVEKAALYLTALGVYEAELNGRRVGEFILAPGWLRDIISVLLACIEIAGKTFDSHFHGFFKSITLGCQPVEVGKNNGIGVIFKKKTSWIH